MHQGEGKPPKRLALVGVLRASVLQLVPGQGQVIVGIQLLRLRSWGTMRPDLRQVFAPRVALGQILPFVVAGVAVLEGEPSPGRLCRVCGPQTVPQAGILGVGEPTGIVFLQLRELPDQRLGALRYRAGAAERQ